MRRAQIAIMRGTAYPLAAGAALWQQQDLQMAASAHGIEIHIAKAQER
jgi:hypothetical protein